MKRHPRIIQGGMGIAVSDWKLALAVSRAGEMGVVSGTAINSVLVRRLQDGDKDGSSRRALSHFPNQNIAKKILETYFIEGGKASTAAYKRPPLFSVESPLFLLQTTVAASFVEVYLAKNGPKTDLGKTQSSTQSSTQNLGPVGINLLEKIQLPNLACLYGALLADVDYVIMGAGIPREIPGALDLLSQHLPATLKVPTVGATEEVLTRLDPKVVMEGMPLKPLKRPDFFPIVSSAVLAASLKKKSTGEVQGFVVEGPLAGGHNAPPRGPMKLSDLGEPIYGPRDEVPMSEMAELGLPFWLAGSTATPETLKSALDQGAAGIQVGTLFAFCQESGVENVLRKSVIDRILKNENPENGWVFTDPVSSPTGFPFKAVRLAGTLANSDIYQARKRICDLGYLRHTFTKDDGKIGYRCGAEPVEDFVKKGGLIEDTVGKKCLCNALMADIGMPQQQNWGTELPLLTSGDDLNFLGRILSGKTDYNAGDVIHYLRSLT